jgi:hypothetical protein
VSWEAWLRNYCRGSRIVVLSTFAKYPTPFMHWVNTGAKRVRLASSAGSLPQGLVCGRRYFYEQSQGAKMSRAEMLSAQLDSLNRKIADVADQRAILLVTHPLVAKHRRLLSRRDAVKAELEALNANIIQFPARWCFA